MKILNLFNNRLTLPKLDESSAIYWKNDNRKKQLEICKKNIINFEKKYSNASKEITSLIEELKKIYNALYEYYNSKETFDKFHSEFPKLDVKKINKKRYNLLALTSNRQIDLYLLNKYEKIFMDALKVYENNQEPILTKVEFYNKFQSPYSFTEEDKIKIKKLKRFILKEEIPLIGQVKEMYKVLEKFNERDINSNTKEKIYNLKIICNPFISKTFSGLSYDEVLKNQYLSLEKQNFKDFIKYLDFEYELDENLHNRYPLINNLVKYKRKNRFILPNIRISTLAKASVIILMFLSSTGKAYAENFINRNNGDINHVIVDENLNQDNNVNPFLINKNIELNNSIIIEKDIHQYIKKYCEERINFLEKIISERKSLINRVFFLRRYKNYTSEEIKRDIESLKEMKSNPEEYINQVVDIIRETIKFLVEHYSSEEFIQRYSENALHWKVDDFKNKSSELGVPIDFTHEKNFKKGQLFLYQRDLINNLKTVKFKIISQETLNQLTTSENDNFISLGGYLRSEHTIYIVPRDLNSIFETILHESLHATYKGDRELTEKEKEILKKSFKLRRFIKKKYPLHELPSVYQDGKSEFLENYHKKPSERIVRKKMLDFELEKLGIKKYDEKFTKEHYTILLKLIKEGKLSKDATEFILSTTRRDLINIMNTIAYNDNDELDYA